jgi:hypothetical protein
MTAPSAARLGAHERAALAGLDVLELEDLEDGAVDLDVVSVLELVGGDRGNQPFLEPNLDVVRRGGHDGQPGHILSAEARVGSRRRLLPRRAGGTRAPTPLLYAD